MVYKMGGGKIDLLARERGFSQQHLCDMDLELMMDVVAD